MEPKKRNIYLNNRDLLAETLLCLEQDKMSDKLAKMLMLLVDRYSKRSHFVNYTYIEDMRAYAQYMLVRTWNKFNIEKSENAFAFYTQCVHNSFIQFLNDEKSHRNIRDALLVKEGVNPSFTYSDDQNNGDNDRFYQNEDSIHQSIQYDQHNHDNNEYE